MNPNAIVGVAHHVSFIRPYGLFDIAPVTVANTMALFSFFDQISEKMDYIGINYYGQVLYALFVSDFDILFLLNIDFFFFPSRK